MTANDILGLEKKQSNIEEFFALLYEQNINPSFLVYNIFPIDFSRIKELEVWQIENNDDFYFVLYLSNKPFLIFETCVDSLDIKAVFCISAEIYKDSIIYLSNNINLRCVPFKNREEKIK